MPVRVRQLKRAICDQAWPCSIGVAAVGIDLAHQVRYSVCWNQLLLWFMRVEARQSILTE